MVTFLPIVLDGATLERRLPDELTAFESTSLRIGDQVVAITWKVDNPHATGEILNLIDEEEHNLAGPAIQLMKLNVPIGPKRLNNRHLRENLLDWYVGEVHILAPDVLPNASCERRRESAARGG